MRNVNKLPVAGVKIKKEKRSQLVKPLHLRLAEDVRKNWILYLMILPVLLFFIIFAYTPMSGVILAFKDFKVKLGIFGSPWVGLKYFERFFGSYNFGLLLKNTIGISLYSLFSHSDYFRIAFELSEAEASEKNASNGFLCALFHIHSGYLRYDRYFHG